MQSISIFDMLKIGIGPSSSHTLGPWRAAEYWIKELKDANQFDEIQTISIDLYGSLSLTGKGHATDYAVMLGLSGKDPETVPTKDILPIIESIYQTKTIQLADSKPIQFDPDKSITFKDGFLPFHANGLIFNSLLKNGTSTSSAYYSVGGGFVTKETRDKGTNKPFKSIFPYPAEKAEQLLAHCHTHQKSISEIVAENEKALRTEKEINQEIQRIWATMLECMYVGCHTEGYLPGGLNVRRRAYDTHLKLIGEATYSSPQEWLESIRMTTIKFRQVLQWVSCFALGVNEVNASLGRVVTAPTNGSAGVIPAVLMYYLTIENQEADFKHIKQFLFVAGEMGSFFKKRATISAAMGGCQAEIGVSSSMAASALCELLGGSPDQVMVAAEIAMEHHLGLTCDPVGGLVQVPCIERNAMGAIKAIQAAELALETNPKNTKVPLDKVIDTMWETAKDMNTKYKETSKGGLAVKVNIVNC